MKYELAKKLKKVGFPQKNIENVFFRIKNTGKIISANKNEYWCTEVEELNVSDPTLSELIEVCGDKFLILMRVEKIDGGCEWLASSSGLYRSGPTPEEAVSNLWLKLNER